METKEEIRARMYTDESRVPVYTVPDPLCMNDGTVVSSREAWMAEPICLRLLVQLAPRARSRACCKAGMSMAANMAMIAMTTNSSINVKVLRFFPSESFPILSSL